MHGSRLLKSGFHMHLVTMRYTRGCLLCRKTSDLMSLASVFMRHSVKYRAN